MYSSYANERSGLQKEKLSWLFNTQLEVSFQSHLLIPYIRVDFEEPLESIASGGVPSEDTGHESQEDVSQEPQQPAEEVEEQKQQKRVWGLVPRATRIATTTTRSVLPRAG